VLHFILIHLTQKVKAMLVSNASAHFSFKKGTSKQTYPSSQMGAIALLRQTYLDAEWYKTQIKPSETNLSLEALNAQNNLPQFFDAGKHDVALRAHKVGKEFDKNYIIVGYGDEYKRINDLITADYSMVLPLNFPKAINPTDPYETMLVSLEELKGWEMAPYLPGMMAANKRIFALTSWGLKNKTDFLKNLRKSVNYGLSKAEALNALTSSPAKLIGADKYLGRLEKGFLANFIITTKDLFEKDAIIVKNYVQGIAYEINVEPPYDMRGTYDLKVGNNTYKLTVKGTKTKLRASFKQDTTTIKVYVKPDHKLIALSYNLKDSIYDGLTRLSGKVYFNSGIWEGNGYQDGKLIKWSAIKSKKYIHKPKKPKENTLSKGSLWFPNVAYGLDSLPSATTILIKNATVWTNEDDGILKETSVLVEGGKIVEIGTDLLDVRDAIIIDAKGMHLTSGIIDEHSHIAISGGVNESGQAIAAEVRIGDVINPNDVNIYRQLAGGVTAAQLLHGSADPIGGQSALIKLKWGFGAEDLKIENAPGFIKFALGENVKQSNWGDYNNVRFPQTRMGVEQVYYDGFYSAKAYKAEWAAYNKAFSKKKRKTPVTAPRRDLELEALLEILESKRFITCHSYIQSEINMLMHVADSMGFTLNTFTHILEGYKLADKMKAHGAGASTFSDWWAYKYEVKDAIPYNASLLNEMGIVTAINSDDAEMARRLNQEAAKAVKYGGTTEQDAWKMVTQTLCYGRIILFLSMQRYKKP